jgi:iron complex outermembrane receptor protein
VVDLDGTYGGGDARWSWHGEVAGHALDVAAGIAADAQRQHRRGYENYIGDALGVRGTLRRDERNLAGNVDRYAQAWWALAPRWSLLAGVRRSEVRLESIDRYVTAANPDDSGRADYARTTPVAGLAFAPNARWRWYLSAGRGFETPTLNELGYRADGGAGLAFDLRPATSRNAEFGMKWRGQDGATVEAAMFRAATDDELAVARNVGGRSSYRNAGRALRQGVEIAATLPIANAWQLSIAHTWLDATFRDGFAICATAGCATPTARVAAGTRIPGTTRTQLAARLRWQEGAWSASAQALAVGRVTVNDTGDAWAPGHALVDLEAAREWRAGDGRLRLFARIDNALDRRYVGSVIVNESNGRYFEPGPDRTWLAGAQWNWR